MRELKFETGGRPLFNDDIKILQEDTYVALTGLLTGLKRNVIISGFEVVGGSFVRVNPGLAFLGGEILRYNGGFNTSIGTVVYISKSTIERPPLDSRTYNDGVEKPAIVEALATISKEKPEDDVPFIRMTMFLTNKHTYHEEAQEQLSSFIRANIGGSNLCILNGLDGLKELVRKTTSGSELVSVGSTDTIFVGGLIYSVLNTSINVDSNSNLVFVIEDQDRRIVQLIDSSTQDNREELVALSSLEYYNDLKRNLLFPTGTILHIKLNSTSYNEYFPSELRGYGVSKWEGWKIDEVSEGRVIVGHRPRGPINAAENDSKHELFETSLLQRGGKTENQLTSAHLPPHKHLVDLTTESDTHKHEIKGVTIEYATGGAVVEALKFASTQDVGGAFSEDYTHSHKLTGLSSDGGFGTPDELENMPPYVVYLNVEKI